MQTIYDAIFSQHAIEYWGITTLDALLPLLPNSSAKRVPPNARAVITCLFPYFTGINPVRNLSYYAVIPDYHWIVGDILAWICAALRKEHPHNVFVPFVDISPIDEVHAAVLCGLGNLGGNSLLINKEYGALCFIGSIITDLDMPPLARLGNAGCTHCGHCAQCCPAHALTDLPLDTSRCLSALTQQKKALTPDQIKRIADNRLAWGCDTCSLACPIPPKITPIAAFRKDIVPILSRDNLSTLLTNRAFAYRGEKVLLRNLSIIDEA